MMKSSTKIVANGSCQKSNIIERQPHKMVKHNQIIRHAIADELFECV